MNNVRLAGGSLLVLFVALASTLARAQSLDQKPSAVSSISECQEDWLDDCRPSWNDACPSVYVQVEGLFMMREPRFTDQPIIFDANAGTTLVSTSDLDFNFDPGLRATVGMRLCEGPTLEFSYFGLFEGNASAIAVKPGDNSFLIFPNNLAGNVFVDMDEVHVNYSSWMHSFELNLPCCSGCSDECDSGKGGDKGKGGGCSDVRSRSFEWFAGLRYLNLGEELNISAQRIILDQIEEGSYNIRTANHLYGAQLGARLRRSRGLFGWEATGKAGIFGNDAQQTQAAIDFPNFPLRPSVSSSEGVVAFVGEVNLSTLYRLTDVWNVKAGYNVMWIEGLALAPDQLDFNFASASSGNQLRNGGSMFLHGVNAGLEARW